MYLSIDVEIEMGRGQGEGCYRVGDDGVTADGPVQTVVEAQLLAGEDHKIYIIITRLIFLKG